MKEKLIVSSAYDKDDITVTKFTVIKMSYEIKCNFKEKLIEMDICRYFGSFTHRLDGQFYFLTDAPEVLTGADLISQDINVLPIYMQVKVSQGLKTIAMEPKSTRKNRSALHNIREYRHALDLDENDDHFLYFQLRKLAKHATDFQHNLLMYYANSGFSHAFYVAPLSLDKDEYEKELFSNHNFENPFFFHRYTLRANNWASYFGFIPFLRNHISIIPHERVNTHEHYYAYSKQGIDVTWHSPAYVDSYPSRLSDRMAAIFTDYQYRKDKLTFKSFSEILRETPILKEERINFENPLAIIDHHAYLLEMKYGIKQMLFLTLNHGNRAT